MDDERLSRASHSRPLHELASSTDENGSAQPSVEKESNPARGQHTKAIPFDGYMDEAEPESYVDTNASAINVNQRQVFRENPNIHYMNGESLSRPMTLPQSAKIGVGIIIAIAVVIACILFYMYFDATTNEPAREQAKVEENLSKEKNLDLPNLLSFIDLDDAAIDSTLKETGATFFERSPVGSGDAYEIVKLPADITLADAAVIYATGISKVSPSEAVSVLNGSWVLNVDRTEGVNMSLHYADFTSGNINNAISNAIAAEGFERGTVVDTGDNDGYGNHYSNGTIMINGIIYSWSVSAVDLSSMYSIQGLPSDSYYVGIRLKGTA